MRVAGSLSTLVWLQALTDALCIMAAFSAATAFVPYPYPGVLIPGVIFGATFLTRAGMRQFYEWPTLRLDILLVEGLIRASLWGLLAAGLGVVALRAPAPSRYAFFGGWLIATGLIVVKRWVIGAWSRPGHSEPETRILVVAPLATARRIEQHFACIPFVRFERFPLVEGWDPATDGLEDVKRIECDEIWVPASVAVCGPALLALESVPKPVRILWDLWGACGVHLEAGTVQGWPFIRLPGVTLAFTRLVKRLFDLAFAVILLALAAPVLIGAAVAIKATSRGPIFFRQTRTGRNDHEFTMLKFRTMYASAEEHASKPSRRRDPRITPLGQFLRQAGIDELPQIINVLRGEMSFVGPRPEMPYKVAAFTPLERLRLLAMPGITGLWQVSVHRSRAIRDTMEYDFCYLSRWSLLLDLLIIGVTIVEIVKGLWGRSIFDV